MTRDDRTEERAWLADLLPKSAHKHIDAILSNYMPERIEAADIVGARVAVDEVGAYGLTIEVDANGNAATVRFPYGAEVAE
ncbi:hypothetical protein ACPXB5_11380 [Micromonospora arida]|uniref:hypothetical protein n=1 Tax=Micromonospora arida TaxID=2203715 RepID=UPI003CF6A1DE